MFDNIIFCFIISCCNGDFVLSFPIFYLFSYATMVVFLCSGAVVISCNSISVC